VPDLIPTGSEAEWLEARRKGVTASEIAVIMGLSPYSSPYKLFHQKTGTLPPDDDSAVMERGRVLEPYIAGKFAEMHPEFFVEGDGRQLYAHSERSWELATPDRTLTEKATQETWAAFIAAEPVAVLECKVDGGSGDDWGDEGTGEIPVHYRAQVLWQMDVMGVEAAYVARLRVRDWRVMVYELKLDDDAQADLKLMRAEARDFLDRLDLRDEPDVDWRPATIDALKTLHPLGDGEETAEIGPQLADRYEAACRNYKHWERRKRLYEARIREAAGPARRVVRMGPGQIPVARRDVYDVRESIRKPYTVDKLTPVKPKKEAS
jgi:putative phage-type endonuclease